MLAERGLLDCTATAFRPAYLPEGAPRLHVTEPAYIELPHGARLIEVPTTHSIGMLARAVAGPLRDPLVHAYFHDTDLLDRARRTPLTIALAILGRRRTPTDLAALQRGLTPAKTMSFANSRG